MTVSQRLLFRRVVTRRKQNVRRSKGENKNSEPVNVNQYILDPSGAEICNKFCFYFLHQICWSLQKRNFWAGNQACIYPKVFLFIDPWVRAEQLSGAELTVSTSRTALLHGERGTTVEWPGDTTTASEEPPGPAHRVTRTSPLNRLDFESLHVSLYPCLTQHPRRRRGGGCGKWCGVTLTVSFPHRHSAHVPRPPARQYFYLTHLSLHRTEGGGGGAEGSEKQQERQLQAPAALRQNSFECTSFLPCGDVGCHSEHSELHPEEACSLTLKALFCLIAAVTEVEKQRASV